MKIWLDDVRPAPEGWTHCYTFGEALIKIGAEAMFGQDLDEISFDHDLGEEKTGYDLARFLEMLAYQGVFKVNKWTVHSANPVGKANIEMAMRNADRYWEERK